MKETDILKIESIFNKAIEPLRDKLEEMDKRVEVHEQTLYGSQPDKSGGMKKVVNDHAKDIGELKSFRTQVKTVAVTIVPAAQMGLSFLALWLKSVFSGKG